MPACSRQVVGQVHASVRAGQHVGRHRTSLYADRQHLPVPLKAAEEVGFVAHDRAAHRSAELVLIMERLARAALVQLPIVRIHHRVAPKIKGSSVNGVRAALQHSVDGAPGLPPILCVVGVGHHLELFHRVHVRRNVPSARPTAALLRNRRTVQGELVVIAALPVDGVAVVLIPAARAGVSGRSIRGCGVLHAGHQAQHGIQLPPIQREILHQFGRHHRAARCVSGIQSNIVGRHRHRFAAATGLQLEIHRDLRVHVDANAGLCL